MRLARSCANLVFSFREKETFIRAVFGGDFFFSVLVWRLRAAGLADVATRTVDLRVVFPRNFFAGVPDCFLPAEAFFFPRDGAVFLEAAGLSFRELIRTVGFAFRAGFLFILT